MHTVRPFAAGIRARTDTTRPHVLIFFSRAHRTLPGREGGALQEGRPFPGPLQHADITLGDFFRIVGLQGNKIWAAGAARKFVKKINTSKR